MRFRLDSGIKIGVTLDDATSHVNPYFVRIWRLSAIGYQLSTISYWPSASRPAVTPWLLTLRRPGVVWDVAAPRPSSPASRSFVPGGRHEGAIARATDVGARLLCRGFALTHCKSTANRSGVGWLRAVVTESMGQLSPGRDGLARGGNAETLCKRRGHQGPHNPTPAGRSRGCLT
jgi:hypothetical protein